MRGNDVENKEKKIDSNFKTAYDMKEIINRCFKECEEAEYIGKTEIIEYEGEDNNENPHEVEYSFIRNQDQVADHIAKTLFGELLEFEVLRKLSPLFRSVRSIEANMEHLDNVQAFEASKGNIRIGPK